MSGWTGVTGITHSTSTVNLARLQQPHLEALRNGLARRHEDLSKAPEMAATIRWLLGIALAQQGLGPDERAARIRELMFMLHPSFPLPKNVSSRRHRLKFPAANQHLKELVQNKPRLLPRLSRSAESPGSQPCAPSTSAHRS